MATMDDEKPQDGYKLALIPVAEIFALTRGLPQMARLTANTTVEVVGDVGPDRKIRMSRLLYEQIEVVG